MIQPVSLERPMLDAYEVAAWLGVHVHTVKRMVARGDLAAYRVNDRGDLRFRPDDVHAFLVGRVAK